MADEQTTPGKDVLVQGIRQAVEIVVDDMDSLVRTVTVAHRNGAMALEQGLRRVCDVETEGVRAMADLGLIQAEMVRQLARCWRPEEAMGAMEDAFRKSSGILFEQYERLGRLSAEQAGAWPMPWWSTVPANRPHAD